MEKYSKHLESIVAERTQDLLQEKQKTDRLLYSKSGQVVGNINRDYCHLAAKRTFYARGQNIGVPYVCRYATKTSGG